MSLPNGQQNYLEVFGKKKQWLEVTIKHSNIVQPNCDVNIPPSGACVWHSRMRVQVNFLAIQICEA